MVRGLFFLYAVRSCGLRSVFAVRVTPKLLAKLVALKLAVSGLHSEAPEPQSLNDGLFELQEQFLAIDAPVKALLCGRRAGKTHALIRALIRAAATADEGSVVLFLTFTRPHAKKLVWKGLQRTLKACGYQYEINATELWIRVKGGCEIQLGGVSDVAEVEKYRGLSLALAVVDECGAIRPHLLQTLYDDVLKPATIDHGGQLIFSGTPGYVLHGPWFDLTGPERKSTVPLMSWTVLDNEALRGGRAEREAVLLDIRNEKDWPEDNPTYIREYLGRWVQDLGALVYPFVAERNSFSALPTITSTGNTIDPTRWRYVIGVDIGSVSSSAFTVVAAHPDLRDEYVLESRAPGGMTEEQVGAYLQTLRTKYPTATIVMDTGGIGKKYAEDAAIRFALPVKPAEKTEKASGVRLCRDRLQSGRIKVMTGEACNDLRGEWAVLGWQDDRDKTLPNKAQPDHASDSCLYALRELYHYTEKEKPKTPDEDMQWERDLIAKSQQAIRKKQQRSAQKLLPKRRKSRRGGARRSSLQTERSPHHSTPWHWRLSDFVRHTISAALSRSRSNVRAEACPA